MVSNKTFLLLFLICIFGCSNDDDKSSNPVDKLPPATQTGQGTFACLVDGKPFIDTSGYPNNLNFNCFYQYVDGGYYFNVKGKDEDFEYTNTPRSIALGTINRTISEGETFQLLEESEGNAIGGGGFTFTPLDIQSVYTTAEYTGELHITKFDLEKQIVSGTFWFDLKNPKTGEKVEIREGRFDTNFGL